MVDYETNLFNVPYPVLYVVKGFFIGDVIHQHNTLEKIKGSESQLTSVIKLFIFTVLNVSQS